MTITLPTEQKFSTDIPRHVAVIMDGNNRWTRLMKLPNGAGHQAGVETVRLFVEFCANRGVQIVTLFAFSSENWRRPQEEVKILMDLLRRVMLTEVKKLHKNNIKVLVIGDIQAFDPDLQEEMRASMKLTEKNTGMTLVVATNYGGQWDIIEAVKKIAQRVATGSLNPEDVNKGIIERELSLAGYPHPDLCIRTGGEIRLSNFLLWQLAYTELYFTEKFWPALTEADFNLAFDAYAKRQRRFGHTVEQITQSRAARHA